jgi:hypothetical protein
MIDVVPELVEIGFPVMDDFAVAIDDPGETPEAGTLVEEFVGSAGDENPVVRLVGCDPGT